MTTAAPLESWRKIILSLFEWMTGFRLAGDGGLSIRSAGAQLHLQGDAGDPAILRVGDGGRLVFDPGVPGVLSPGLYYSPSSTAAYTPVFLLTPGSTAGGTLPTILGGVPGTPIAPSGSAKATCA